MSGAHSNFGGAPRVAGFSFADSGGGAAKAAYRLHTALRAQGAEATLHVLRKESGDPTVRTVSAYAQFGTLAPELAPRIDQLPRKIFHGSSQAFWSTGWYGAVDATALPGIPDSDVLMLYWVTRGLLGIKQIGRLLATGKPVIWRLSDMWPFTGGCHYSQACVRYEQHCGECPQLSSSRSSDLSAWLHRAKRRHWAGGNLTIVAPSSWMAEKARRSSLFADRTVKVIPTGVDCNLFRPIPKETARNILGLPLDRPLILYGATSALSDPRKGGDLAVRAYVRAFESSAQIPVLIVFGSMSRPAGIPDHMPVQALGIIRDESMLALIYSACDVFVAPSREENLANSVLEAMACGLPVLSMNVGGMSDAIEDGRNGRLVDPAAPEALADRLRELIEDKALRERMSVAAREMAVAKFSAVRQAQSYIGLFEELLT
jgi:glycosyltransferase involved in cell wall biosynthesis